MWRHQCVLGHFPRTGPETKRLVVQRAHRAQVDDVAGQLMIHGFLDVGADLVVLAATGGAELRQPHHVLPEAHAARAMDAAGHVGGNQWPEVLVLDHALALVEARDVAAIAHRQVLQLALAALVADGAIQRMIDQQEFHHRFLGGDGLGRSRVHDHAFGHRRGAGRHGLGRLFHLDQAHAAVGRNRQLLVVAKARHIDIIGVGDPDQHLAFARLGRDTVDSDHDDVVAHAAARSARTMLRPPWSIMYSNSWR